MLKFTTVECKYHGQQYQSEVSSTRVKEMVGSSFK